MKLLKKGATMDKRRKRNSSRSRRPARERRSMPIGKILPKILAFLFVISAIVFIHRSVYSSDYFVIEGVNLVWHDAYGALSAQDYDKLSLMGRKKNIFKLDIQDMAKKILGDHPEFKDCIIERQFPNELAINIFARQPIAEIDCGRFYLISKDSIILSRPEKESSQNLTIINGITWKPSGKIGEKYESKKSYRALKLISAIKSSGLLNEHKLESINIADYSNIKFYIDGGLLVKIGHKNFRERLSLLNETLSSSYVDVSDLEYIDLRFDDIVFGTK